MRQSLLRIFTALAFVLPVLFPLLLLFDPDVVFPGDWTHHLWIVGYFGEYFRQHGDFPSVINLGAAAGTPLPIFYGCQFYPLVGLLSAPLGSALALRIAIAGVIVAEYSVLVGATRRVFKDTRLAYLVTVATLWATYSVTALFNRGAIPEFFATSFLVIAVSTATLGFYARGGDRRYFWWMTLVLLVLTLGSHPPTALVTALFILALSLGVVVSRLRGNPWVNVAGRWLLTGGAIAAFVLAPWIYAAARFSGQLGVASVGSEFLFFPDRSDSFWARFAPFPYDGLSIQRGIYDIASPYLEAPINIVLLAVLVWNLELCRRLYRSRNERFSLGWSAGSPLSPVIFVALVWFGLLALISISPPVASLFRLFAPYIQYPYRLVSHCNLALLVGVLASASLVVAQRGYRRYRFHTALVLAACLPVAAIGFWIKFQHAAAVGAPTLQPPYALGGDRALLVEKGRAELGVAYHIPGSLPALSEDDAREATRIRLEVAASSDNFGDLLPATFELNETKWVVTNVVVFPWGELLANGNGLDRRDLARVDNFTALRLPAGKHTLSWNWRPDSIWRWLHRISQAVFGFMLVATVLWSGARAWRFVNGERTG